MQPFHSQRVWGRGRSLSLPLRKLVWHTFSIQLWFTSVYQCLQLCSRVAITSTSSSWINTDLFLLGNYKTIQSSQPHLNTEEYKDMMFNFDIDLYSILYKVLFFSLDMCDFGWLCRQSHHQRAPAAHPHCWAPCSSWATLSSQSSLWYFSALHVKVMKHCN